MAKNIFGKTRDINKPYAEYLVGDIVYRILKTYKMAKNETKFPDKKLAWVVAFPTFFPKLFANPPAKGIIKIAKVANFQFW